MQTIVVLYPVASPGRHNKKEIRKQTKTKAHKLHQESLEWIFFSGECKSPVSLNASPVYTHRVAYMAEEMMLHIVYYIATPAVSMRIKEKKE